MTNFVTGATGLLGSYLCRYLIQKGERVTALHRKNSSFDLLGESYKQIDWIKGELNDRLLLADICQSSDLVYHLAAKVSYQQNERQKMYDCNVLGTRNVTNAALNSKVKKLLYVSSIAALGKPEIGAKEINEQNEPEQWNSKYGHSKYLGELEIWRAQAEGLPTVIINPSVIIGGGYWNANSGKLFKRIRHGFKYYTNGTTGFVDVRDVVKIMHQLMHTSINEERFIVSAENLTYKDLFALIAKHLNVVAPNKNANKNLQQLVLFADWCKSTLTNTPRFLTRELIATANTQSIYNNNKLKKNINYNYATLEETIAATALVFKKAIAENQNFALLDF